MSTDGEKRGANPDDDSRRASSRGLIPKAKIKTVKMTLVIVFGETLMRGRLVISVAFENSHVKLDTEMWRKKVRFAGRSSPCCTSPLLESTSIHFAQFFSERRTLSHAREVTYPVASPPGGAEAGVAGGGPRLSSPCPAGVASYRRIPAVEWVVVRFFPCLECSRQPLEPRHTLHRYGTDYTSVSDASTRRHTANSVRYTASTSTASTASQDPKPPNSTRNGLAQSPAATKGKAGSEY
ncbi:hypothetical protein E2C01_019165 [Portunus trituberculatus]|uniref:Uncharacterized protein n=1 Tax=Portunus trituberculatus TaxID=210409 RepID=A0A5B7DYG2_PORTR|nr:hypothetical protein [Portunus trituberculatus]